MSTMMLAITPTTAAEREEQEMFQRVKTPSLFLDQMRPLSTRPRSEATDIIDNTDNTDFEDDSNFEESDPEDNYSPKSSFEWDDGRRTSQTTISSFSEAATPSSGQSTRQFEIRFKPVEGPRGPHLFRASQESAELAYDFALQMSPLLPRAFGRTQTAFSEETVIPAHQRPDLKLSIPATSNQPNTTQPDSYFKSWTPHQVIDWMASCTVDASVIDCFERHDIDGTVLADLQFDDLRELGIQSFGKRHQLWSAICELRGESDQSSPQETAFDDTSRPCTSTPKRSASRRRSRSHCRKTRYNSDDDDATPITPSGGKKRRGRKAPKALDIITPAESVSIVAIEQLLPKPHNCTKGERCSKWRKQQRQLKQLQEENGIGRFPVSPTKGGRIYVAGDPGNAATAENIVPNVHKQQVSTQRTETQPEDELRPTSEAVPSVVASSDLMGPGQLPEFALHAEMLGRVDTRDPQDNVRQFLSFQHMQMPPLPSDDAPPTPPEEHFYPRDPFTRSESVPPIFPARYHQAYPSLYAPPPQVPGPFSQLKNLPRLDIPRSASAAPKVQTAMTATPDNAPNSAVCRSMTASPVQLYRFGTPASDMDVPVTAIPTGPVSRDISQSVPADMQYHQVRRPSSRVARRQTATSGATLPAVKEGEVLSASSSASPSSRPSLTSAVSSTASTSGKNSFSNSGKQPIADPSHHQPNTQYFGYGEDCTHAGWMKKRKTKMLRHEWQESHFRLKGTQLGMYPNARLSTLAMDLINVDDYAVACSSSSSGNKLSAAIKALHIKANDDAKRAKDPNAAAFAFQLVPMAHEGEKRAAATGKTHHFAVKTKDERIDWMREIMLAKALQAKGKGFEVEVNGVAA